MTTSASRTTDTAVAAAARRAAGTRRLGLTRLVAYAVLLVVAAAILFPIVYAVLGGFKTNGQLAADPGSILPNPWVFTNYTDVLFGENAATFWRQALQQRHRRGRRGRCSSSRSRRWRRSSSRAMAFRGREALYTLFVFGLLFPSAVAILPLYILVRELGLSATSSGSPCR